MTTVQNIEDYRKQVKDRVEDERSRRPPKKDGGDGGEIDLEHVWKCYHSNEIGDSILFNQLNEGKFAYNVITGRWMRYVGPHWEIDYKGRGLAAIETTVVPQYLRLLRDTEDEIKADPENKAHVDKMKKRKKGILSRIDKLRSVPGRKNCMICAATNESPLVVHPDQLDQHPWLLATPNGVIDLRTGEGRPGDPEEWITKVTTTEWRGIDAQCPKYDEFIHSALDGDQEKISFLDRCIGYALTGLHTERIFVVLYGKHGQNGKGTIMEIMSKILGVLAGPVQSEMLISNKSVKNGSAPSPEILDLKGQRLVWASETSDSHRFAADKVKLLTGGDKLTGRGINDKEQTKFWPTHTLFLLTNNIPSAPPSDDAFWERTRIVEFPFTFKADPDPSAPHEKESVPGLADALLEEAPGILARYVRGCLEYQRIGLSPPDCVMEYTKQHRKSEDTIGEWIDERCEVGAGDEFKTPYADLYNSFTAWWSTVSPYRPMTRKKFGEQLSMKFEKLKTGGTMHYLGIRLKSGWIGAS